MPNPTPHLQKLIETSPGLMDRIFDYILADPHLLAQLKTAGKADDATIDKIKTALCQEFKGEQIKVTARTPLQRQQTVHQVLALFNGRNATEVARRLQISRATVYRILKQPGQPK